MKSSNVNRIVVLFLLLVSIGFVSCEEEVSEEIPTYDLVIPSTAYSFAISSVSTDTETIVYASPSFTENFDILGCAVMNVKYYVDNALVSTETSAPFKLEQSMPVLSNGLHILKAVITVRGENFRETTAEYVSRFSVTNGSRSQKSTIEFNIDYDYYLRVGEKFHASINMIDRYNAGYKIEEIKFYLDEKLIKTTTGQPYDVEYSPTVNVGQKIPLKFEISYLLGDTRANYSFSSNVDVLPDDETRYLFHRYSSSSGTHYNNGEVIAGTGLLYKGNGDDNVYELNLYWDDKLIGSSKTFPYKFSYTINNAEKGIHKFKKEWKKYDKNGNSKGGQSTWDNITIDE